MLNPLKNKNGLESPFMVETTGLEPVTPLLVRQVL